MIQDGLFWMGFDNDKRVILVNIVRCEFRWSQQPDNFSGETKCIMCSKYVLWWVELENFLYGIVLEHHNSCIMSLDIF